MVQERQRLGEALDRDGRRVDARPLRQLVEQLVEVHVGARRDAHRRRRGDLLVDLLEVHGVPDVRPEPDAALDVADGLRAVAQDVLDGRDEPRPAAIPCFGRELGDLARRDAGADERLVRAVADAHQLVGREVVVEVARVGEEHLAAQLGEPVHRVAEVELEALDQVPVLGDTLAARARARAASSRPSGSGRARGSRGPAPRTRAAKASSQTFACWPSPTPNSRTWISSGSSDHSSRRSSVSMKRLDLVAPRTRGSCRRRRRPGARPRSPSGRSRPRRRGGASSCG